MKGALILKGGRVIDPSRSIDEQRDLFVLDGRMVESLPTGLKSETLDVSRFVVCPGLMDIHVHLREPGQSAKETIATGTRAAAAGGFTTVVAMPNTSPAADTPSTIAWIQARAADQALVHVLPTGCISQGMQGEMLAPIGSLKRAGVVAITDDGRCIQNNELMRRALEYAKMFDLTVMDHCQDYTLTADGVMNEGYWSTVLGLRGWPAIAEEIIIARNALLSELTGCRVHCQHVTTAGGVRIIREAKERGVRISGEVCPHHITLTDESLQSYDTDFKMNPPLRTRRDIQALIEGIRDGTIEILASDHAPHCAFEKEVEFDDAPFGIVGLETELGLFLNTLVHGGVLTLSEMISRLTDRPAKLLGLDKGTLAPGSVADITVIDPELAWTVDKAKFESRSKNTPFHGMTLKGRAVRTLVAGETVWTLEAGICDPRKK
jgi:dihydroorotase